MRNCCLVRARYSLSAQRKLSGSGLTHINDQTNHPQMVDVSHKSESKRSAVAQSIVLLPKKSFSELFANDAHNQKEIHAAKGPVFATAIIAGVMAVKNTSNMIPFCHPIMIDGCDITINPYPTTTMIGEEGCEKEEFHRLLIQCAVKTNHKTGVEMEALVGASAAALCVYDMLKALSHDIQITETKLLAKSGGKRDFKRTP